MNLRGVALRVIPVIYLLAILVYFAERHQEEDKFLRTLKSDVGKQRRELQALKARIDNFVPDYTRYAFYEDIQTLDLEDTPALAGPREEPVDTNKSLVVICIGNSDKQNVDSLMKYFPPGDFTYLLLHYDDSTWHEFSWYTSTHVVAIRVIHKMKFWYLKRFLPPSMARAFSHIIILDADVKLVEPFDTKLYLKVMDAFNLTISQPAHVIERSHTEHSVLYEVIGDQIGRFTEIVEYGPAVFLTSQGYRCIYHLMQTDLTSGMGLDILWVDYIETFCKFGPKKAAVLDKFLLTRTTATGFVAASSQNISNDLARAEMEEFFIIFPNVTRGHTRPGVTFGFSSCLRTANPASNQNCSST